MVVSTASHRQQLAVPVSQVSDLAVGLLVVCYFSILVFLSSADFSEKT